MPQPRAPASARTAAIREGRRAPLPRSGSLQGTSRDRNLLRQIPVLCCASVVADGARGGLGVELVRVVENGRFGGSRRRPVVVARDGVEELGEDGGVEVARTALDHP